MTEEHREKIGSALRGKKHSQETRESISKALLGHEVSEETRKKISVGVLDNLTEDIRWKVGSSWRGKKMPKELCEKLSVVQSNPSKSTRFGRGSSWRGKKIPVDIVERASFKRRGQKRSEASRVKMSLSHLGQKSSKETKENVSAGIRKLIAEGRHHWASERPCNNPTERVLDFALILVFIADTHHNFKIESQEGRNFQLDFVSYLLHVGVEADESEHDKPEKHDWDVARDQYIKDSKTFDFTFRYRTVEAITDLSSTVKEIYRLVNQQREKYKLYHLPILVYDDRWTSYFLQMQELLKEWFEHPKDKNRFKTFRTKKREIDKQWLWLLEEECKKYDSNFAVIYREILEKNLKLSFKNVTSPWRKTIHECVRRKEAA